VANSEIRNLKEQLKKQGYSDVTIEEILRNGRRLEARASMRAQALDF